MSRIRALGILVLLTSTAVVLTACDPGPSPAPTASSTDSGPTPTATAAPDPEKPRLEELTLSTEGLGEVRLGIAPPTDDPATNIVAFDADACEAEGLPGIWKATYPDIDLGYGPLAPFAIGLTGEVVTRIDVNSPQIYTDTGIHLGSSIDEVLGVYSGGPDAVVNHADVSDVYVILGTNGKLQFEVAVDRIPDYWDPAAINTVVFLSAIDIYTEPYGVAASDNTVGVCTTA